MKIALVDPIVMEARPAIDLVRLFRDLGVAQIIIVKAVITTLVVLGLAAPLLAQPVAIDGLAGPLATHRTIAAVASDVSVGLSLAGDTVVSWRQTRDCHCASPFVLQGVREGVVLGSSMLIKHLVHRTRPDRSDTQSFWSQHTMFSASAFRGPRLAFIIPLVIGTGEARILADKHYLTDVLAGAAAGVGASFIRPRGHP